jgi:hypothetical protein
VSGSVGSPDIANELLLNPNCETSTGTVLELVSVTDELVEAPIFTVPKLSEDGETVRLPVAEATFEAAFIFTPHPDNATQQTTSAETTPRSEREMRDAGA